MNASAPHSARLVVAAHGTASAAGRAVVEQLASQAAALLGVPHGVGYVDVCEPTLDAVLASETGRSGDGAAPIVVPAFLATGYHVRHDVPAAVAQVPGTCVTPAFGPSPEVVEALADRVVQAQVHPDGVVLAGAGSSVVSARDEVAAVAELLGERLGVPVRLGFLTGAGGDPTSAVVALRQDGARRIVLAPHLLAPGHFHDRSVALGASLRVPVSGPLGGHPALARLIGRRYVEAERRRRHQGRDASPIDRSPAAPTV